MNFASSARAAEDSTRRKRIVINKVNCNVSNTSQGCGID